MEGKINGGEWYYYTIVTIDPLGHFDHIFLQRTGFYN
jgi:hypothetical protein